MNNLFNDDSGSEIDETIRTNKDYVKSFTKQRQKAMLQKCK